MNIQWRHDWLLALGITLTITLGIIYVLGSGPQALPPYATGFLIAFSVAFGIVRAVGQRGIERREAKEREDFEGFKTDLEGLLGKLTGGTEGVHRVGMDLDSITTNVQNYIDEGANRTEESREHSALMVHKPDCETPWLGTDCDCEPLRIAYNEASERGAEDVAKEIYAHMRTLEEAALN